MFLLKNNTSSTLYTDGSACQIVPSTNKEIFASKSNPSSNYQTDPEYTNDRPRQAAATNVKLVVPYIRCSIIDALGRAVQIGNSKETNYEPDQAIDPANIDKK